MDRKKLDELKEDLEVMLKNGPSESFTGVAIGIRPLLCLVDALQDAVQIIKEGKRQFTPNTTNSLVDDFLKRWDRQPDVESVEQ